MDFSLLFFLICLSTRNPCTGTVYIIGTDTGVGCHSAGAGQVVPGVAKFQPSGNHPAGLIKVIPLSVNIFPAIGSVAAVLMTIPPAGTTLNPAGRYSQVIRNPCTGTVDITGTDPGVGCHSTGTIQIIPGTAEIDPSGCHSTGSGEVIPGIAKFQPSGNHPAGLIKVIPLSVNIFPAIGSVAADHCPLIYSQPLVV